jgi:TRAP-type mannitol/chloroaromatic compound transport system permease small subunit
LNDVEVVKQAQPFQSLNRWMGAVTRFFVGISAVMVILMALATTYSVVRRYLLSSPDNNAFLSICIITLVFAVFSWAEVQRLRKHIVVDYFSDRFNPRIQEILQNIVTPILGLLFCSVLAWKNWAGMVFAYQITQRTVTNIAIPVYPLRVMITFGVILLGLVLLVQLATYLAMLWYRMVHKQPRPARVVQSS